MTPLQEFANTIMKAGKAFNADRGIGAWLVFHETKQSAHAKLMGALLQLKEIQDFWRYVQSMRVAEWLPVIEAPACANHALEVTLSRLRCGKD